MKYTILTIALLISAIYARAQTAPAQDLQGDSFILQADIEGLEVPEIYLTYGGFHNSKIDTTEVVNGQFSFSGKVDEPVPAMVFTPDYKVRFDLYVEKGKITVSGRLDALDSLQISGPPVTNEFAAFNGIIMANRSRVNRLNREAYKHLEAGDTLEFERLQEEVLKYYNLEFDIRKDYIIDHPESYISAHELFAYSNVKTVKEAVALYDRLEEKIRNSSQGEALLERLNLLGRVQVGEPAIQFVQQDQYGKKVSLDSFKGEYVLVEFWASWCGPCRAENPNLLRAYEEYHDKGFSILGVSLDESKEAWVNAIQHDAMPWTQVADLKGWKNEVAEMYGIRAVPANFLVSPQGEIVALDLRGEVLNKKLKEIFN